MLDRDLGLVLTTSERIRRLEQFPEDPEKRFEAVFAAIGNSEAKCVTLLCLTESPSTRSEAHREFVQKTRGAWNTSMQESWVKSSLSPIGLVAEVDIVSHNYGEFVYGMRLTESGRMYGQPVASWLLSESSDLPFSLQEIFGPTSTGPGALRPVLSRAAILEYLAKSGNKNRSVDMFKDLGIVSAGQHLQHLAKIGLVHYSSIDPDLYAVRINYELSGASDAAPSVYNGMKTMTALVTRSVRNMDDINVVSVLEDIKRNYDGEASEKTLRNQVNGILSHLEKQGILNRKAFKGGVAHSDARITDLGLQVVSRLIIPVKAALRDEEEVLAKMQQVDWAKFAPRAVLRHREVSGHANTQPHSVSVLKTLEYIVNNPGSRHRELKEAAGSNVSRFLKELISRGKIIKQKKGMSVAYYEASSRNPSETPGPIF